MKMIKALGLIPLCLLLAPDSITAQVTLPYHEDFTDSALDLEWQSTHPHSFSAAGLRLATETSNAPAIAQPMGLPSGSAWSIRTEGRIAGDGFLAIYVGPNAAPIETSYGLITSSGSLNVGTQLNGGARSSASTRFDPRNSDTVIQLDTFDNRLRLWAWEQHLPPLDSLPLIDVEFDTPLGVPGLWTRHDSGPAVANYRSMTISDSHLEIPLGVRLPGDWFYDGERDITDLNLLCGRIRSGEFEEMMDLDSSGQIDLADVSAFLQLVDTLPGDADLDGSVDFRDFVALADRFGRRGGWRQGDFDCNGRVGFPDFLLLSRNYNGAVQQAYSVPEVSSRCGLLIAMSCVFGIRDLRSRSSVRRRK